MKLMTINQTLEKFPAFTQGGLRHLIFYKNVNGIGTAIIRVGRRIYFEEEALEKWLEAQRDK